MNNTIVRLSIAALSAALLASCGGGGSSAPTATEPVKSNAPSSGNSGSTASFANGTTKMTLSLPQRTTPAAHKTISQKVHSKLHTLQAARKKPQYVSYATQGLKVVVASGTTSATYNIDVTALENSTQGQTCIEGANYNLQCTITIPTLGTSENILVLDLDEEPTGTPDPVTGISTGDFPSDTAELANGSSTATLTPGGITNIAIALNPVIAVMYDCGFNFGQNLPPMVSANNGTVTRLVFSGGLTTRGTDYPEVADFDGNAPRAVLGASGTLTGQPFVDLNGLATAVTAVSSVPALTLLAETGAANIPTPPLNAAWASTVSFPDSSWVDGEELQVGFKYDGTLTPSASYAGTVTYSNNLSAAVPVFGGASAPRPCCNSLDPSTLSSYLMTPTGNAPVIYYLAPLFAVPAATSVSASGTLAVTGYDPGSNGGFYNTTCNDTNGTAQANVTANGPIANGVQTFTLTPSGPAGTTCTFNLHDEDTYYYYFVQTAPVTIQITT